MARTIQDLITNQSARQLEEEEFEDSSQAVRSAVSGYESLKGSFNNAGAAVSRKLGAVDTAEEFERDADLNASRAAGIRGAVPEFDEVEGIGDAAAVATDALASNAPLAATNMVGAGIGGAAGFALGGPPGAVVGGMLGGYIPYAATSTGENYSRLRNDPNAEGTPEDQAGAAIAAGAAQGALGAVPMGAGVRVLTGAAKGGIARQLAGTAVSEGVTEMGESAISRFTHGQFNPQVNMMDAEARREYLQSALMGSVVGGGYGAIGLGVNRALSKRAPAPSPTPVDASIDDQFDDAVPDYGEADSFDYGAPISEGESLLQAGGFGEVDPVNPETGEQLFKPYRGKPQGPKESQMSLMSRWDTRGDYNEVSTLEDLTEKLMANQVGERRQPVAEVLQGEADRIIARDPERFAPVMQAAEQEATAEYEARRATVEDMRTRVNAMLTEQRANPGGRLYSPSRRKAMRAALRSADHELRTSPTAAAMFLQKFSHIRKTTKSDQDAMSAGQNLDFSADELLTDTNPVVRLRQTSKYARDDNPQNREIMLETENSGPAFLDTVNLTNKMLRKLNALELMPSNTPTMKAAAIAFSQGMASIAAIPEVSNTNNWGNLNPEQAKFGTKGAREQKDFGDLDPELVVFRTKGGRELKVKDIPAQLTGTKREFTQEKARIKEIQETLPQVAPGSQEEAGLNAELEQLEAVIDTNRAPLIGFESELQEAGTNDADTGERSPERIEARKAGTGAVHQAEKEEKHERAEARDTAPRKLNKADLAAKKSIIARNEKKVRRLKKAIKDHPNDDRVPRTKVQIEKLEAQTTKLKGQITPDEKPVQHAPKRKGTQAKAAPKKAPKPIGPKVKDVPVSKQEAALRKKRATAEAKRKLNLTVEQLQGLQDKSSATPKLRKMTEALSRMFHLPKSGFMTVQQAADVLAGAKDFEKLAMLLNGRIGGFHKDGRVYINPRLSDKAAVATLAHELGHAVQRQHIDGLDKKGEVWKALNAEYNTWRQEAIDQGSTGGVKAARRPAALIAEDKVPSASIEGHPRRTYILSFEEWFADNVARWVDTAALPQNALEKFFYQVAQEMKRLLQAINTQLRNNNMGRFAPAKSVTEFMDQLSGNTRMKDTEFGPPPPTAAQQKAAAKEAPTLQIESPTADLQGKPAKEPAKSPKKTPENIQSDGRLAQLSKAITDALGLEPVRMLTKAEARSILASTEPELLEQFDAPTNAGIALDNDAGIYISSERSIENQRGTLLHELGHIVEARLFGEASPAVREAIKKEYEKWRRANKGGTLRSVEISKKGAAHIADMNFGFDPAMSAMPPERREYVLDFSEWFADNIARWADTSKVPKSVTEKFFKGAADAISKLIAAANTKLKELGLPSYAPAKSVAAFMDAQVARVKAGVEAKEATAARREAEANGGGLLGSLHSWHNAFEHGQSAVLSKRLVAAVKIHIHQAMAESNKAVLRRAATAPAMQAAMANHLGGDAQVMEQIQKDPEAAMAYLYALTRLGHITPGPQTRNVISEFTDFMVKHYRKLSGKSEQTPKDQRLGEKIFGDKSDEIAADTILRNIEEGQVDSADGTDFIPLDPELNAKRRVKYAKALRDRGMEWYDKTYGKVLTTPFERLMRSKNPHLVAIGRHIANPAWSNEAQAEGFIQAKNRKYSEFRHMYSEALGGHHDDAEFRAQVLRQLRDPSLNQSAAVKDATAKMRKIFDRIYRYSQEAGLTFAKRKDYFPWIFSRPYLESHMAELRELAGHANYRAEWEAMYRRWVDKGRLDEKNLPTLDDFITQRLNSLLKPEGIETGTTEDGTHNPGFRYMNARDLNFLQTAGNFSQRAALNVFFEPSLDVTMNSYIASSVKRTEHARRFGKDGSKLNTMIEKAQANGATEDEVALVRGYVNAAIGMYGYETRQWINDAFANTKLPAWAAKYVKPGDGVINEHLSNRMGWVITYQNYRNMVTSVFAAFVDTLGVGVRTGDLGALGHSLKRSMGALWDTAKGDKNTLIDMGHMLGTIERAMISEDVAADYTSHHFSGQARKLNDALFKYNGVETMTKVARVIATAGAEYHIVKHEALRSKSKDSEREMSRLGLRPGDAKMVDGQLQFLSHSERDTASKEERARDDRLRAAMHNFVDSTTVRPDASKRPLIASDPHTALIFQYRTFIFAFHDTIWKPMAAEAQRGNLAPAAMLFLTFAPMMLFADWLRDMVKYGPDGADWKRNWTIVDHLQYSAKRAGYLGRDEIVWDALMPLAKGDPVGSLSEALGPTAQQLNKISKWGTGVRDLPGQVLYKNWF